LTRGDFGRLRSAEAFYGGVLGLPLSKRWGRTPAAREQLEAQGVTFRGDVIDSGVCLQAIFADPDGNTLILHHRYAPEPA
jgi:hypothetical protein